MKINSASYHHQLGGCVKDLTLHDFGRMCMNKLGKSGADRLVNRLTNFASIAWLTS
jgi:hypothetical protein